MSHFIDKCKTANTSSKSSISIILEAHWKGLLGAWPEITRNMKNLILMKILCRCLFMRKHLCFMYVILCENYADMPRKYLSRNEIIVDVKIIHLTKLVKDLICMINFLSDSWLDLLLLDLMLENVAGWQNWRHSAYCECVVLYRIFVAVYAWRDEMILCYMYRPSN